MINIIKKNTTNNILQESQIWAQESTKISLVELLKILEENRQSIILNLKQLRKNYQRKGIKRVPGYRDENGSLIKPLLTTEFIDQGEYVGMGSFEMNRNSATINMLISRGVRLIEAEENTSMFEVAGVLLKDLAIFSNYTIVCDGKVNVKSLQVKISRKKVFDLLKEKGVLEKDGFLAEDFDFRSEYTIRLDNLPLVPVDIEYSDIDGLFEQLAEVKVLISIISAHLKQESDVFVREQLEELKKYYLSKNVYINFPTTNEHNDTKEAVADGLLNSRISYKIDIGNKNILNLDKLQSANKFLNKMYYAYDKKTGNIFTKPTFALEPHIAFKHKQMSPKTKITKVDELMKPIFDDFLGLENNGIVEGILAKVGDIAGVQWLHDKRNGKAVSREETVAALSSSKIKLEKYIARIFQEKICFLVFYIGCKGHLPDTIKAKAMTFEELAKKYPNLQFSNKEQNGKFFEVGNSIISVHSKTEYYQRSECN